MQDIALLVDGTLMFVFGNALYSTMIGLLRMIWRELRLLRTGSRD